MTTNILHSTSHELSPGQVAAFQQPEHGRSENYGYELKRSRGVLMADLMLFGHKIWIKFMEVVHKKEGEHGLRERSSSMPFHLNTWFERQYDEIGCSDGSPRM